MSPTSYQAAPPRDKIVPGSRSTPHRQFCKKLHRALFRVFYSRVLYGGDDRDRTGDLLLAKQALSQLSYAPNIIGRPGQIRTADLVLIRDAL
jgi:hypothetical protein